MRTLLIVGASVRAATQSAHRAGFRVIAADLFADRDTRLAAETCIRVDNYPGDFAAIRCDFPDVPLLFTGALENYPDLLREFSRTGRTLGNSAKTVQRVSDPIGLQRALRREELPCPAVRLEPPSQDDRHSWMQKSLKRSGGGQSVQRWPNEQQPSGQSFFQQYIEGQVVSAAYLSTGQACDLIGTSDMLVGCEWLGCKEFVYCGSILRNASPEERSQWKTIGDAVVREFELIGAFGVDAIVAEDGVVWPIEVNPRYTASMEIYDLAERHYSVIGAHVQACEQQATSSQRQARIAEKPPTAIGKAILYANEHLEMPSQLVSHDARIRFADLPAPGERFRPGEPMLTLIADPLENNDSVLALLKTNAQHTLRQFIRDV